jgi:hypothetical protein
MVNSQGGQPLGLTEPMYTPEAPEGRWSIARGNNPWK